jgi:hypothetical protein
VTGSFRIYGSGPWPATIHLSDSGLRLSFSQYKTVEGIDYADEVRLEAKGGGPDLIMREKRMVFNRSVPMEVFSLHKPVGFETVYLAEEGD